MHELRQAKIIARFMLVWFVFSMGLAAASPVVSPKAMELVCTTGGAMKLVPSADDNPDNQHHTMPDCAMCMLAALPSARLGTTFDKPSDLSHALHPIAAAHIASATAPPLPSRGPPAL
jgi:hypothetical protein